MMMTIVVVLVMMMIYLVVINSLRLMFLSLLSLTQPLPLKTG